MPSGDKYTCQRYDDGSVVCVNVNDCMDIFRDPQRISDELAAETLVHFSKYSGEPRESLGNEVIALDDTTVKSLTLPVGANHAEYQFNIPTIGGNAYISYDAVALSAATVVAQGFLYQNSHTGQTTSMSEAQQLQVVCETGVTGELRVQYYKIADTNTTNI